MDALIEACLDIACETSVANEDPHIIVVLPSERFGSEASFVSIF